MPSKDTDKPVLATSLGPRVCAALGVEPNMVTEVTLTMHADSLVRITIRRLVTEGEADALVDALERYQAEPRS